MSDSALISMMTIKLETSSLILQITQFKNTIKNLPKNNWKNKLNKVCGLNKNLKLIFKIYMNQVVLRTYCQKWSKS